MTKKPAIKWPAADVQMVKVESLVPYARNARTHSDEQVAQLCASIKEWGWTVPILLDEEKGIIAGHGRIMAARKLGLDEVPAMTAKGWTEAQRRAYVLADNKLALNAGWDDALLGEELRELDGLGFDLDLTGFGELEIEAFLPSELPDGSGDGAGSLAEKFGIPPFSVLNAREGWWQSRKRSWLALGIKSELGRGEQLIPNGGGMNSMASYNAAPGGALMPAMDYSRGKRGNGKGQEIG